MQFTYRLYVLVDKYASAIEKLNLDGDALQEYSSMLLRLQNQVETEDSSERIVEECLDYLNRFVTTRMLISL